MLLTVYRKLSGNRWKILSLTVGLILAIAIAFSIPIYTNAILNRMITKTLENSYIENNAYPTYFAVDHAMTNMKKDALGIAAIVKNTYDRTIERMGLPAEITGQFRRYEMFLRDDDLSDKRISYVFHYVEHLEDHVNVTIGRMYNAERDDGVVEVVVPKKFLVTSLLTLNQVYELDSQISDEEGIKIEIVGVIEASDPSELFWYNKFDDFRGNMFAPNHVFQNRLEADNEFSRHLTHTAYYAALDYKAVNMDNIIPIVQAYEQGYDEFNRSVGMRGNSYVFEAHESLEQLIEMSKKAVVSMYILIIPIFILLAIYIIMVARLKLDSEQSEISVMQSRGASRIQILRMYFIESVLLISVALIAGPPLGIFLCRIIGASNGFLEFINRRALPLEIRTEAIIAVVGTAFLFLIITMIPAFFGAGVNIIESKQKKLRPKLPFYHRYFLDFIALGIGAYGFMAMESQRRLLASAGLAQAMTVENTDFLMYTSSTLFALGAGMLFLRIYPLLIRLIFAIGKRIWPAWLYFSLNRLGRNRENMNIMLFIIVTLSIGVFSADAARSINKHIQNNVNVSIGADLDYMPVWKMYDEEGNRIRGGEFAKTKLNVVEMYDEDILVQEIKVTFFEIFTDQMKHINGIENIARVYRQREVNVRSGSNTARDVEVMFIDPLEFAKTANYSWNMNPYHLNEYVNALASVEEGVLISESFMKKHNLLRGDVINIYTTVGTFPGKIIGIVKTWPGISTHYKSATGELNETLFVIGKLEELFNGREIVPYGFWINKENGVSDREVFDALSESDFGLKSMESSTERLIEEKNKPILQGTNGMLSVSFLTAVMICALGFLIFWIISIRSRTLQFGVSRALGMTKIGIMLMLVTEQILVSGVAVMAGILIGKIGSLLFVPMLALNYSSSDEIVPFGMIALNSDLVRIVLLMGSVLFVCFGVLSLMVIKQKIDRAVKLGEE